MLKNDSFTLLSLRGEVGKGDIYNGIELFSRIVPSYGALKLCCLLRENHVVF